jgi:hypothetical protein
MTYVIGIGSGCMTYIPNIIQIAWTIQMLLGVGATHACAHTHTRARTRAHKQ